MVKQQEGQLMIEKYSADITAGALLLSETKVVAGYLLDGKTFSEISKLVEKQNILQKRSVAAATRMYSLIRHRLQLFDKSLWSLIYYGDSETARMAALAATIKDSRILADFMLFILKEKYQLFEKTLDKNLWNKFIIDCTMQSPDMPKWSESTAKKVGDSVYRILAETGYISDTKTAQLQKVYIPPEVKKLLEKNNDTHILKCLVVSL